MTADSRRLRSQLWFDDLVDPAESAVYIEPFAKHGVTRAELQSGRPVIGIAQTGSEVSPCNLIHVELAARVKAGIRDAGGTPLEFPVHPLQETLRRPTAALDRNLSYLGRPDAQQLEPRPTDRHRRRTLRGEALGLSLPGCADTPRRWPRVPEALCPSLALIRVTCGPRRGGLSQCRSSGSTPDEQSEYGRRAPVLQPEPRSVPR